MDPTAQKLVRFDRFALDLTRGCLWSDDKEIDLPPKAFQVLTCLALNAGRLVPKEELLEAAWGSVAVSDESLAQSIRQLRQKLGDHGHGLIKTVSRRGYRLEATLDAQPLQALPPEQAASAIGRPRVLEAAFATSLMPLRAGRAAKRHIWVAASGFVCVVVAAVYLLAHMPLAHTGLRVSPPAATLLFTTDDAARIADIAKSKELPLPAFEIREPARDVPGTVRRFVGIWVSETGWIGSNRQLMIIVTHVDRDGIAIGYAVDGPPQPTSRFQDTAGAHVMTARISADTLAWESRAGLIAASLARDNRLELRLRYRDERVGFVSLDPAWTLVEAERFAATHLTPR